MHPGELWCEGDSCDLVPANFSLLAKSNIPLKERRFQDVMDMHEDSNC